MKRFRAITAANALIRRGRGISRTLVTMPSSFNGPDPYIVKYETATGFPIWQTTIRGGSTDRGLGIAVDSTGVYATGRYTGFTAISLGNGVTLPNPSASAQSTYIVKYNLSGVAQWQASVQASSISVGYGITVDSTGVYVVGNYTSTTTVSLGNGVTLPISVGQDAFIIKYNLSGVAQWATTIPGDSSDIAYGIAVDSTGVYVTGNYTSTTTVSLGNGVTLPISVGQDAFIVKYNLSGVAQWQTTVQGSLSDYGKSLVVDSTGVYVVGNYNSTTTVSLGNGVTLPISSSQSAFIVKYDLSGVAQWQTTITSSNLGYAIAVDSTGVYVTGLYASPGRSLGNGVTLPTPAGANDAFIVKYNLSGIAQWATTIRGSAGFDTGQGIAVDSTGVYVSGIYYSTTTISLGNGVTLPIASSAFASFLVKYDLSGVAQWQSTIKGSSDCEGFNVAVDSTGVYVTGYYSSSAIVTL